MNSKERRSSIASPPKQAQWGLWRRPQKEEIKKALRGWGGGGWQDIRTMHWREKEDGEKKAEGRRGLRPDGPTKAVRKSRRSVGKEKATKKRSLVCVLNGHARGSERGGDMG